MLSSLYIYTHTDSPQTQPHTCMFTCSITRLPSYLHTDTHTHTHTHTSCETAKNKKDATRMFKIASFFLDTPRREVGGWAVTSHQKLPSWLFERLAFWGLNIGWLISIGVSSTQECLWPLQEASSSFGMGDHTDRLEQWGQKKKDLRCIWQKCSGRLQSMGREPSCKYLHRSMYLIDLRSYYTLRKNTWP